MQCLGVAHQTFYLINISSSGIFMYNYAHMKLLLDLFIKQKGVHFEMVSCYVKVVPRPCSLDGLRPLVTPFKLGTVHTVK